MGKGRAPCCDKSKVKRGPWSPAEDLRLITFIQKNGHHNWRSLPRQAGLLRCGKSCRLRWINYLRPDVKRGNFTKEEEDTIIRLHQTLGNKWSKIASYLPGRTDNEIKNVWHTNLKKKLDEKNYKDNQSNKGSPLDSSSSLSSSTTQFSHGQTNSELDHHQMDHHDDGHNHHHTMPKNPSDEDPLSSSELLEVELSKQFDSLEEVDKPDMIVLPSVASPICNHLEEVNKLDMIISSSVGDHQTPLESDLEFWNRLDGIEAFFSNDEVDELLNGMGSDQSPNFQSHVHNNNKNKNFEEVDSNNWLKYLEHELGLEDTGGDEILINKENPQPLIPSESCNDQIMRIPTEVDNMGMGYFHHQQLIPPESCDQIMDNIPIEVDMGMGYFHHHHHHHHHAWPSYQSPRHSSVF